MQLWIMREDNNLYLTREKPFRDLSLSGEVYWYLGDYINLNPNLYPDITSKSGPVMFKLTQVDENN